MGMTGKTILTCIIVTEITQSLFYRAAAIEIVDKADDLVMTTATSYILEGVLVSPFTASTLCCRKQRETTLVKFPRK